MYPFERQYSFLLDLADQIRQSIFQQLLHGAIAYTQSSLVRCQYKRADLYRSWQDFRLRRVDLIWAQQRWDCLEWLWPCEGEDLVDFRTGDRLLLEELVGYCVHFVAGIARGSYDVCWIRAPIDLRTVKVNSYCRVYQGSDLASGFAICTQYPGLLEERALQGAELGALCSESWIYKFSIDLPKSSDLD